MRLNKCLDSETLTDYLEGRLRGQANEWAEHHLSDCSRCLEELFIAGQVFRQRSSGWIQAVPPGVTQRTIAQIDRIQAGGWWDWLMGRFKALSLEWSRILHRIGYPLPAALTPVRGRQVMVSDDIVLLSHSFTGMDADLEIEKIDSHQANLKVTVSSPGEDQLPMRVSLVRDEREVASYLIGQKSAYFESVPFGRYTLVYTHNGANIGQFEITIKSTDDGA